MGSWNGTCALTNMPIHEGSAISVHILAVTAAGVYSDSGSGYIHANANAKPMGPALYGEYNGYGGVQCLEGAALPWWESHLTELKPYLGDYLGLQEDEEVDFASIDDFINSETGIERTNLYLLPEKKRRPEDFRADTRIGLMYCHMDAYTRFMSVGMNSDDWMFQDKSVSPVEHYTRDLEKRLTEMSQLKGKLPPGYRHDNPYARLGLDPELVLRSIMRFNNTHNCRDLLQEVAALRVFDILLETARKSWGVQVGAGSSYSETNLQVELARCVLEYAGTID